MKKTWMERPPAAISLRALSPVYARLDVDRRGPVSNSIPAAAALFRQSRGLHRNFYLRPRPRRIRDKSYEFLLQPREAIRQLEILFPAVWGKAEKNPGKLPPNDMNTTGVRQGLFQSTGHRTNTFPGLSLRQDQICKSGAAPPGRGGRGSRGIGHRRKSILHSCSSASLLSLFRGVPADLSIPPVPPGFQDNPPSPSSPSPPAQ